MNFTFGTLIDIEPVRLSREAADRDEEEKGSFHHHHDPFRHLSSMTRIRAEVEAPKGMTEAQQNAFVRAFNATLRRLPVHIAEEFSKIETERIGND